MGYFQLKTGYQKYGQVTTSTVKVLLLMNPVLVNVRFRKNRVRMSVTVWPSVFILATSSWNIKKTKRDENGDIYG
jgi:tRNA U54 and U55 pseudouridine synthase Pus10